MSLRSHTSPAGPATHYELFSGLLAADVSLLVAGDLALVLHGVPRLTSDIRLVIDPDPENLQRLERLLASWGYGETAAPGAADAAPAVRRFRHPLSALGEIDAVLSPPDDYARLLAGEAAAFLVDIAIPLVGAADLREISVRAGTAAGNEDAAGLDLLAALRAGCEGPPSDTRREQIRKFSRWSVAARLDWLLAAARLARGLSPEARPMTRGLTRRRGWYGGR